MLRVFVFFWVGCVGKGRNETGRFVFYLFFLSGGIKKEESFCLLHFCVVYLCFIFLCFVFLCFCALCLCFVLLH